MLWIRWKTVKRVIYFICKYRCLNVLVIILNIFIMVGIMISCLKIMFLPRCSEHMSVINYLTVRYFPADIISPFHKGGTLWPNVCFLNVTRTFSDDLAFSIGVPSKLTHLCPTGIFLLPLNSKVITPLVMNYHDPHAQDRYHVYSDAEQSSQCKGNKLYQTFKNVGGMLQSL